ncbi:MAG: transposase [Lentisphaerae bacterium]|nr:transposase [Lentisphaerota bacterium]
MVRHVQNRAQRRKRSPRLGDVVRERVNDLALVGGFGSWQMTVLQRIAACGTGLLGWVYRDCSDCGSIQSAGLGCQDRHCPGCGAGRAQEWSDAREEELLDCNYFHFVFTWPGRLYPLFLENQQALYGLAMRCVNDTLKSFAKDPKFLGGTPSAFAVLHTTNRQLDFHPHIHVAIAGAGLNEKTGRLVTTRKQDFLFPARALAAGFRRRLLQGIEALSAAGKLTFNGPSVRDLASPRTRRTVLAGLRKINWQVHTKQAFGGPKQVIRYLARYTHRTAISDRRIVALDNGNVTYAWADRKTGRSRFKTLPVMDFIRKFTRHILPKGFKRVRLWGLLSPPKRRTALPLAQRLAAAKAGRDRVHQAIRAVLQPEVRKVHSCPDCGTGTMRHLCIAGRARPPRRFPAVLPTPPPMPRATAPPGSP